MSANASEIQSAYTECERIARNHYENFPVGSLLIPKRLRPHFYALYAFMRTADDFADLPGRSKEERLKLLDNWRRQLKDCYREQSIPGDSSIFLALKHTIHEFSLERSLLDNLLDAFEFDARGD